jgi:hypothetical protein
LQEIDIVELGPGDGKGLSHLGNPATLDGFEKNFIHDAIL